MPWSLVAAAFAGSVLALRFRVPALIAATALLTIAHVAAGCLAGVPIARLAVTALASVLALQGGYLAGLLVGLTWRRIKRGRDLAR